MFKSIRNNYYCILDLETGGREAKKHAIAQIGFVIVDQDFNLKEEYCEYIKPYGDFEYEQEALDYNSISMEEINNGKSSKEVLKDLIKLAKKYSGKFDRDYIEMVNHNQSFDKDFMQTFFSHHNEKFEDYFNAFVHDTLFLTRLAFPKEISYKLQNCLKLFDIELIDAHDALSDAKYTLKLFKNLVSRIRSDVNVREEKEERFRNNFTWQI